MISYFLKYDSACVSVIELMKLLIGSVHTPAIKNVTFRSSDFLTTVISTPELVCAKVKENLVINIVCPCNSLGLL